LCGKNDNNNRWNEIAEKIKIIYDSANDYHPEYEGYAVGEEVKQADTILVGYPLQFQMKMSTRKNDLRIYENSTRKNGPAMTFSMFAVNYLDIEDYQHANTMLNKSFIPYIRKPFNIWSEVANNLDGATNFITGAGGFLQTIFNGFLGIRINADYLEIKNPQLPRNCNMLKISGFKYLKSKFEITVMEKMIKLKFLKLKDKLILVQRDGRTAIINENSICKRMEFLIKHQITKLSFNSFYSFR
jgi:protein-glucosylgalactosylhydroxylysine glucosidase